MTPVRIVVFAAIMPPLILLLQCKIQLAWHSNSPPLLCIPTNSFYLIAHKVSYSPIVHYFCAAIMYPLILLLQFKIQLAWHSNCPPLLCILTNSFSLIAHKVSFGPSVHYCVCNNNVPSCTYASKFYLHDIQIVLPCFASLLTVSP
jgi:hypothetical protein